MTSEKNQSLVSVIVPVYNCESYLAQAIDSVLAQTYRPIEIIVVDDGSIDDSAEIARSFTPPVRYYFQENAGIGAARNRGTELAQGEFLSFLDADDLWHEGKTQLQMAVFEQESQMDMVFGLVQQFISPELDAQVKARIEGDGQIMPGYLASTMLIKREAFLRIGPFATHWDVGEFVDWYLRAMEQGLESHMLNEIVLKRRLHDANIGVRKRTSRSDYVRILKAALDRRRREQGHAGSGEQERNSGSPVS